MASPALASGVACALLLAEHDPRVLLRTLVAERDPPVGAGESRAAQQDAARNRASREAWMRADCELWYWPGKAKRAKKGRAA